MRWRRHIRNWLLGLLGSVAIILASISLVLETELGSRWLLRTIAGWVPVDLGEIRGDLRSGLDISYLDYRNGQQHFRIEQASFRWRPISLVYGALSIQSLQVQRLLIELPPPEQARDPAEPFSNWPRIGLPFRIELGQAQLNQIEFRQGETRLDWKSLSGSLSLGTFHLRYTDLGLVHKDYSLTLTGVSDLWFPYETDADLEWRIGAEDADSQRGAAFPYRGTGKLNGDMRELQLIVETSQPVVIQAEATSALVDQEDVLIPLPHIQLNARWNQQQLPTAWWLPGRVPPVTTAELMAEGNWRGYTARLQGDLLAPDVPGLAVLADVKGDTRGLVLNQLRVTELVADAQPAQTSSEAASETVVAEGVNTSVPAIDNSAKETQAKEKTPAITPWLELKGNLGWITGFEWNLDVQGEHLNLANLAVDWPSNLQLRLNSQGRLDYATKAWHMALGQLVVDGSLRDLNLEIKGDLQAGSDKWHSQGLRMVLGANQLDVKGGVDKNIQLDWNLRAPMLGQLDTEISGSLISKGQILGQLSMPQVMLDMSAENFSWRNYRLVQLALNVKPGGASPPIAQGAGLDESALRAAVYTLQLNGKKLQLPGVSLSSFSLNGEGSINQHQMQVTIKSPRYGSLEFALKGRYGDRDWLGSLQQASIKLKNVPRWWLVSGKPIHISKSEVSVGDQCFTTRTNLTAAIENNPVSPQSQEEWNPNQSPVDHNWLLQTNKIHASPVEKLPPPRLCLNGTWMPEPGLRMNAKLDAVPLRQFYALFKSEVYFAGVMNGSLDFSARRFTLGDINAHLDVATRNAELRYQFPGSTTETYAWENTRLYAQLEKGVINAKATMQWVGYGYMEANTRTNLINQEITNGKLFARFDNLAPLETLVATANDVAGNLNIDLTAGGKLHKPEISGVINLHKGSANLPKLGLDLTNINLRLTANKSEQINLVGEIQSGKEGKINLDAELSRLGTPEWQARGNLRGNDFKVINIPQLKIDVNPDIELQADASTMRFSGAALIPWARAAIKTLPPSTTRVSNDVIIEDEQELQVAKNNGVEIYTNIKLTLGDDVRFKGFGLDSELGGEVQLFKDAQRRQLLTNGFVAVKKGTYKAYGQTLSIERGRLIFQGPYENPGLDIRASRTIEEEEKIQVGLEISGTLQRPTARVYSLGPDSYSDSESMMMLLTGKPVTQESRAEATLLMGALSGLGDDSESISTNIAHFFRVDELAIKSEEGIDQSELWIGKQLTPKLMVRYVVGLFDQLVSLGMEYQLNDRLRIEAESGEKQSVDVIYRIER